MPKTFFKKILPSKEFVQNHRALRSIAHLLQDPNLFHLNRSSVSRAVSISLAVSVIPFWGHMLISAVVAVWLRANIAISVILVWISNPLTFPFIILIEYKIGQWLLKVFGFGAGRKLIDAGWQDTLLHSWKPILTGSLVLTLLMAIMGYFCVQFLWRWGVWKKLKKRREKFAKS